MPVVSIIVPTYNNQDFLEEALQSALSQSFSDWQLFLINDGSTDRTEGLVQKFVSLDKRICPITHKSKMGLVFSLNEGINLAEGEYLARLDGDDIWIDKHKLQKQVDFLNLNPRCGLLGSWAEVVSQEGAKLYNFTPPSGDSAIRKEILLHNPFMHSSVLIRKQALMQSGGYEQQKKYVEDYSLWLKIGHTYELGNLPEIMLRYRINTSGITQTNNSSQIKAAIGLIFSQKQSYPGYWMALFKWSAQYGLTLLSLNRLLLKFKKS